MLKSGYQRQGLFINFSHHFGVTTPLGYGTIQNPAPRVKSTHTLRHRSRDQDNGETLVVPDVSVGNTTALRLTFQFMPGVAARGQGTLTRDSAHDQASPWTTLSKVWTMGTLAPGTPG